MGSDHYTFSSGTVKTVVNLGVALGSLYLNKKYSKKMSVAVATTIAEVMCGASSFRPLEVWTLDLQNTFGGVSTVVKKLEWE